MISPTMSTESALIQIIRPMREKVWSAHFAWNRFERFENFAGDYGPLDLCPDFQRGHVWTEAQQTRFIEAALRGALTSRELTECSTWLENHSDSNQPTERPRG